MEEWGLEDLVVGVVLVAEFYVFPALESIFEVMIKLAKQLPGTEHLRQYAPKLLHRNLQDIVYQILLGFFPLYHSTQISSKFFGQYFSNILILRFIHYLWTVVEGEEKMEVVVGG